MNHMKGPFRKFSRETFLRSSVVHHRSTWFPSRTVKEFLFSPFPPTGICQMIRQSLKGVFPEVPAKCSDDVLDRLFLVLRTMVREEITKVFAQSSRFDRRPQWTDPISTNLVLIHERAHGDAGVGTENGPGRTWGKGGGRGGRGGIPTHFLSINGDVWSSRCFFCRCNDNGCTGFRFRGGVGRTGGNRELPGLRFVRRRNRRRLTTNRRRMKM
mmetsp:Transcript_42957/g.110928  ORF Transcript_42957/g.110928 Transcript_42957/m.110928 type:complete len:213 (+) Transcript_42957:3111-3749(+)